MSVCQFVCLFDSRFCASSTEYPLEAVLLLELHQGLDVEHLLDGLELGDLLRRASAPASGGQQRGLEGHHLEAEAEDSEGAQLVGGEHGGRADDNVHGARDPGHLDHCQEEEHHTED